MIIQGTPVDSQILTVQKSIAANLQNKDLFQSENQDTAENGVELRPPISMKDCLYVFKNSSISSRLFILLLYHAHGSLL